MWSPSPFTASLTLRVKEPLLQLLQAFSKVSSQPPMLAQLPLSPGRASQDPLVLPWCHFPQPGLSQAPFLIRHSRELVKYTGFRKDYFTF